MEGFDPAAIDSRPGACVAEAAAMPRSGRGGSCAAEFLGRVPYETADAAQRRALGEIKRSGGSPHRLILWEPEPVVTLGRRADPRHVLASGEALAGLGMRLIHTDRGGDVTYHGPGQLVAYFVFDLGRMERDIARHARRVEEVAIRLLGDLGVEAFRVPGKPGVWTAGGKIASIGLSFSRWVSYHGLAVNIGPDLRGFSLVVPCGLAGVAMRSASVELGRPIGAEEAAGPLARAVAEVFGFDGMRIH